MEFIKYINIPIFNYNYLETNKIKDNDIPDFPVKGLDSKRRPYLIIKIIVDNGDEFINIFYKRYTHFYDIWRGEYINNSEIFFDTTISITSLQCNILYLISLNYIVQITKFHHTYDPKYIGKYICNKKVWNSILIIQRAWRKYKNIL